jgi:hypothetical protein
MPTPRIKTSAGKLLDILRLNMLYEPFRAKIHNLRAHKRSIQMFAYPGIHSTRYTKAAGPARKYICEFSACLRRYIMQPTFLGFLLQENSAYFPLLILKKKLNSMVLVREQTIPTERTPFVGEVIAKFCG